MSLRIRPQINRLPTTVPFVGPETQERQMKTRFRARLGANESVFGPAPSVIAAMSRAAAQSWKYPDPENFDLKAALAARLACAPDNIVVGEGIDGLLGYLVRLLVEPGVSVVTSDGAYPTFNYHVAGYGGTLIKVPYQDDREDPDALLAAVTAHDASLLYLSNPDNPMGTWLDASTIEQLIAALPPTCLLCLDEAYLEFAPGEISPKLDPETPNVIRMRTFSKAYGMAGMRIGYAIAPRDLASAFNKIRNHFGVNLVAQAGAIAALSDQEYLQQTCTNVDRAKQHIAEIGAANGLVALPSATNFVTLDCGRDGAYANGLLQQLVARGVFVRKPFVAPQDRCIRITAGTDAELDVLAEQLPQAIGAL